MSESPGQWPEDVAIRFYAESSVSLPGMGDQPESCGAYYPSKFCTDCGNPHFEQSTCETRTCPFCWSAWRRRRAEQITVRLGSARAAADPGLDKRAVHVVGSPPTGSIKSLVDIQRGYRETYELARAKGIRGGVAIFHGFRVTDAAKDAYDAAVESGDWLPERDGKLWRWVRQQDASWRDLTYWSPHYHLIGLARDVGWSDADEQEGWILRRIRSLDRFSPNIDSGYKDMIGLSMYLLSHATFETTASKHSIRWFGELSTNQFSPESELDAGLYDLIATRARELAGTAQGTESDTGGSGPTDEQSGCRTEGCSGEFAPIWEAGAALSDPRFCDSIASETESLLNAAFQWAIGDRPPPDDQLFPKTRTEAREILRELAAGT